MAHSLDCPVRRDSHTKNPHEPVGRLPGTVLYQSRPVPSSRVARFAPAQSPRCTQPPSSIDGSSTINRGALVSTFLRSYRFAGDFRMNPVDMLERPAPFAWLLGTLTLLMPAACFAEAPAQPKKLVTIEGI